MYDRVRTENECITASPLRMIFCKRSALSLQEKAGLEPMEWRLLSQLVLYKAFLVVGLMNDPRRPVLDAISWIRLHSNE